MPLHPLIHERLWTVIRGDLLMGRYRDALDAQRYADGLNASATPSSFKAFVLPPGKEYVQPRS